MQGSESNIDVNATMTSSTNMSTKELESVPGYPDCEVRYAFMIGNGVCNNYGDYNTEVCGFDGGDCLVFNKKYPNCLAPDPIAIGDGICQNYHPYYSRDCGWDEHDCSTVVSIWIILIGVAYIVLPLALLESRRRMRNNSREAPNPNALDSTVAEATAQREQRREIILTSIIHKTLVTKQNSNVENKLNTNAENSVSKISDVNTEKRNAIYDLKLNGISSLRDSSKMCVELEDLFLVSPRSCPICYEDFEKDNDIALSRNTKCHHVYHVDCIMQWLMENDDCPMCRYNYLGRSNETPDSAFIEQDENYSGRGPSRLEESRFSATNLVNTNAQTNANENDDANFGEPITTTLELPQLGMVEAFSNIELGNVDGEVFQESRFSATNLDNTNVQANENDDNDDNDDNANFDEPRTMTLELPQQEIVEAFSTISVKSPNIELGNVDGETFQYSAPNSMTTSHVAHQPEAMETEFVSSSQVEESDVILTIDTDEIDAFVETLANTATATATAIATSQIDEINAPSANEVDYDPV